MPQTSSFKVSAPGSTLLMGEHAVLRGEPALVCAVDARMELTVTPRTDRRVLIDSALGHYAASLDELPDHPELRFVLTALRHYRPHLHQGMELVIRSAFASTIGLGSSAAITAALVTALDHLTGLERDLPARFRQGLAIIHEVQQGRGSGADLAASLYGGLLRFTTDPVTFTPLSFPQTLTLSLFYSGYKMKTAAVLQQVEQQWHCQPELLQALYRLMGQNTRAAEKALAQGDLTELGRLMNVYQGLMDALGVCDATLSRMVYALRQDPQVLGAKISGSGLGDCVLALSRAVVNELPPHQRLDVRPAAAGVLIHHDADK